jgi:hypothetical protein
MRTRYSVIFVIVLALVLSACGSAADVEPLFTNTPTSAADAMTAQAVLAARATTQPTETLAPTTAPATATPLPATPTAEALPTETPAAEAPAADDPVTVLVSLADPARGQELFNTTFDTASGPYMCGTCHLVDSESMLIGPGLYNIKARGAERVAGESVAQYIFNSIKHPGDYVVEGFVDGLMPQNYADILTDDDVYNLVAYLLTLE